MRLPTRSEVTPRFANLANSSALASSNRGLLRPPRLTEPRRGGGGCENRSSNREVELLTQRACCRLSAIKNRKESRVHQAMRERGLIAADPGDCVRATFPSKAASALTWPFTCGPKASAKGGNHMPRRDNKTRKVNISGTRLFLMLAFAFLSVQLLLWLLVRYELFAP